MSETPHLIKSRNTKHKYVVKSFLKALSYQLVQSLKVRFHLVYWPIEMQHVPLLNCKYWGMLNVLLSKNGIYMYLWYPSDFCPDTCMFILYCTFFLLFVSCKTFFLQQAIAFSFLKQSLRLLSLDNQLYNSLSIADPQHQQHTRTNT